MKKLFCLLAIIFIGAISLQSRATAQDAAKPISLVGTGYSSYERKAIITEILEPNQLTFEDGGNSLLPSFGKAIHWLL